MKEEALDDLPSKDGQERAIVNQTNTGTVSKPATLGKLPREAVERVILGFSQHTDAVLN